LTPRSDDLAKPLPDPDALENQSQPPAGAPLLLDPRDKTAAYPVRRAWTYSPIKTRDDRQPSNPSPTAESWDASGWRSVK
jgi:hypothetical protein